MRHLFLFISVFFLFSCQPEGRVYIEHQELSPQFEWLKKDIKEFKVPVEDASITYNLSLSFRFSTGYQFEVANVLITEISPSGKESSTKQSLKVRNEKGEYLGEPGFDIWDSEHLIEVGKTFSEQGIYTFRLEHIMPTDPLNYALEIGVILDKQKVNE